MKSLIDWLKEPWAGRLPFNWDFRPPGLPENPTRLQVIAALGGMDTGGYGVITSGSGCGPYGRKGLEMEEAHVLWRMQAFIDGWLACSDSLQLSEQFAVMLREEWKRVELLTAPKEEAPPIANPA